MKTRIGILGMGGVGGYFGGQLAKEFEKSNDVEIICIARGKTLKQLQEKGLTLLETNKDPAVISVLASDDPTVIGQLDFLICATKTYDIDSSLVGIKKCITKRTIICPLYNGVDSTERIATLFPENEVLQACVYIIANIKEPGVIEKVGPYQKLIFGSTSAAISKLNFLQSIFQKAAIDSHLVQDIEAAVWEKFIFISALASATCYLNTSIGGIVNNLENRQVYVQLLEEIVMLATVKGIAIPADSVLKSIEKLQKSPQESTSSMHRDWLAGRPTEVQSLTAYVVEQGKHYEVATPMYSRVLEKLISK